MFFTFRSLPHAMGHQLHVCLPRRPSVSSGTARLVLERPVGGAVVLLERKRFEHQFQLLQREKLYLPQHIPMASRKTGFQGFQKFQELEKLGLGDSVDLHVYEIPVEYKTVQRLIPALWEKHSPQLVVHVGVSGMATTVTLEKCGHNKGYKGLDNCRFCPGSQCCVEDGPESIDSIIDMDAVCERVTTLGLDVSVTISQDAGRYLCDFTYYTSLYQSHGRSAFVHVPPLGKPYNADQLGRALRAIIAEMLGVLEQSEGKINCRHKH